MQSFKLQHKLTFIFFIGFFWVNCAEAVVPCVFKMDTLNQGAGENTSGFCAAMQAGANVVLTEQVVAQQDVSLAKQAESVAQEILTVQNLVIQTEQLMKDIEENPLQVIVPDVNQILKNQKRIDQLTRDISNNSSSVGANLIKNLEMPDTIGLGQGSRFQMWNEARKRAIDESFDTVSSFTKDLASENVSISKAIQNLNGSRGQRANAKALSNAAGQQLTTLGKIEEALLKMLSLQSAEAGSRLEDQVTREEAYIKAMKRTNKKPSSFITDKEDIVVGNNPSFFGIKSINP